MDSTSKALVIFVIVYCVGVLARSIIAKEREQKTFAESMKDKSNHATAGIVALVVAAIVGLK